MPLRTVRVLAIPDLPAANRSNRARLRVFRWRVPRTQIRRFRASWLQLHLDGPSTGELASDSWRLRIRGRSHVCAGSEHFRDAQHLGERVTGHVADGHSHCGHQHELEGASATEAKATMTAVSTSG